MGRRKTGPRTRLSQKTIFDRICIRGGAFKLRHSFREEDPKDRFFFVLNDAKHDGEFVLVTASTRIEERRKARFESEEVLVDITPKDYPGLKANSIIDCDSAELMPVERVLQALNKHEVLPLDPLPDGIMTRLRAAIACARTLSESTKKLVLGEDA